MALSNISTNMRIATKAPLDPSDHQSPLLMRLKHAVRPNGPAENIFYAVVLSVSISLWFIALRAPLWLDETGSVWQIAGGFSRIPYRLGGLTFPAYFYILWFSTKILGSSEIALRIPSIIAMLGAVYLLFRAAETLFERGTAQIAVILFSTHPVVIFAAIDARPYAFAALAISATIYLLVRLHDDDSNWRAAQFGAMAAVIVWFQFLFVVILPALVIGFFAAKLGGFTAAHPNMPKRDSTTMWRQFAVAIAAFAVAFLPVIPGLIYMFRSRATHPFDQAPTFMDLAWTLAPGWFLLILGGTALIGLLIAAWTTRNPQVYYQGWHVLSCASLALVPILILYAVSFKTPLHVFVQRYRLVAIPGIALAWAMAVSGFRPRLLRALFCVSVVATAAHQYFSSPLAKHHGYTWKYALEFAERNASADKTPLLICSDLPESNHTAMPLHSAKDSNLFVPLSYYKVSVPVVPLPRALNDEAIRVISSFVQEAAQRHQRFLALAYIPSYGTLEWTINSALKTHSARELGVFDGIKIVEFVPRIAQLDVAQGTSKN